MNHTVLYLAIDVFSKGGIQRYSRAQIGALRDLLGTERIRTLVLRPKPGGRLAFEEQFDVESVEKARGLLPRLRYIGRAIMRGVRSRPRIIWTNHVKMFPLAQVVRILSGASAVVGNVYGLEVWSGLGFLERLALRRMTHLVSDSHFTAGYLEQALGVPPDRISVIWDPVDVTRFTPRPAVDGFLSLHGIPPRPGDCYLMTLGRVSAVSRHKGYDRILDLMHKIDRNDIVYIIVGDGDDRERLAQRVKSEGLAERVYLIGGVPESELVDIYNVADVFILVSDRGPGRGEGVPLAVLEAAACGVPVIVGDEDGSQEAVVDGVSGFIVSPQNLDAIRSAVLTLAEQPALRTKMGLAARRRVEDSFAYTSFREKTKQVLSKLP